MSSEIPKIPIEPEVDLVVEFVNTRDLETGADSVGESRALERWIDDHVGGPGVGAIDPERQGRLLALRESLRALLRTNNGGEAGDDELRPLREAAERSRFRTTLHEGRLAIDPAGDGPEAFEARLLLALERIQSLGAWPRLKACPTDHCQWAFYDTSRNRSRTWCSMEECGNRAKTRRYRRRKASA